MSRGRLTGAPSARSGEDKAGSPLAVEAELEGARQSLAALRHLANLVGGRTTVLFRAAAKADPSTVDRRLIDTAIAIAEPLRLALDRVIGVALTGLGQPDPPPCTAPAQSSST